jgi:hypothetical protein
MDRLPSDFTPSEIVSYLSRMDETTKLNFQKLQRRIKTLEIEVKSLKTMVKTIKSHIEDIHGRADDLSTRGTMTRAITEIERLNASNAKNRKS